MITVSQIRKAYPTPGWSASQSDYCVAGALGLYLGVFRLDDCAFPSRKDLAFMLSKVNPMLTKAAARALSSRIIVYNDLGRYEEAWKSLDQALRWKQAKRKKAA